MNKELIDIAWACLPREFREEVKKEYYDCKHCNADACAIELEVVFGEYNLTSDAEGEEKPAEPKLKCEDRVRIIKENHPYYGKIATVDTLVNGPYPEVLVNLRGNLISFNKSDLEPYTEPKENLKPSNSWELESQQTRTQVDNIVKDGFREHNRLHIAAMCLQGMLSAGDYSGCPDSAWSELAKTALACADALLVEAQKGGE